MRTTLEILDAVIAPTKDLVPDFKDVKPYPLNRLLDGAFFQDVPSLKLPACLWVFRDDEQGKKPVERTAALSAVVIVKDIKGTGYIKACEYVDTLRAGLANKMIGERLWCGDRTRLVFIDSGDQNLVAELQFWVRDY